MDELWSSTLEAGTCPWRSSLAFIVGTEYRPGSALRIQTLKSKHKTKDKPPSRHNEQQSTTTIIASHEEENSQGEQDSYKVPDEILLQFAKTGDMAGLEEHIVAHRPTPNHRYHFNANCTDGMSSALFYACEGGHDEFAAFLLDHGAEVDTKNHDGVTALFIAAQVGAASVVRLLMSRGADPSLRSTRDDVLPLYVACFEGHLDVVKELLRFHQAKECEEQAAGVGSGLGMSWSMVNAAGVGTDGSTALMASCERGHRNIVEFLLSNGADVDARAKGGETALLWAVQEGYFGIVELLLQRGSNVNMQKLDGATPLLLAVLSGDTRMVSLLRAYGARNDIATHAGDTPRRVARRTGLLDIAALLATPPPVRIDL